MKDILDKTESLLLLRNYSAKTRKSYLLYIMKYLTFSKKRKLQIRDQAVELFLLDKQRKKLAPQTINLALNAIKFFYREVLQDDEPINIKCVKRSRRLPVVLSRMEIQEMISVIQNPKHRLIVSLTYAAGLRVSETVSLKIEDIDVRELTIHIKNAKGRKDRISVLPKKLVFDIKRLTANRHREKNLFESTHGGKLTTTTAQRIFKNALKRAKN